MRTLRNVAIIVLVALALTIMPAGGNIVEGILVFLGLVFGAAIAALLIRFWNDTSMQRDTMTDRQRWLIYGSLGAIALMIVGTDELLVVGRRDGRLGGHPRPLGVADLQHLARGSEPASHLVRRTYPTRGAQNRRGSVAETLHRGRHACARPA